LSFWGLQKISVLSAFGGLSMSDILLFLPRLGNLEPPGEMLAALRDHLQAASGGGDP